MLLWISLWLISELQPVDAHDCRSLYFGLQANLPRRSWNAWSNETCWEQCFVVREDLALIMNNNKHTQYEWCVPAGRSGFCIIDQGIKLSNEGEVCDCTIITRFPRILKNDKRADSPHDRSCTVDAIKERLSVPRGGKYTDFPVVWKPTAIPMYGQAEANWVDHVESGLNVECAVGKGKAHEHCGSHGECVGEPPEKNFVKFVFGNAVNVASIGNILTLTIGAVEMQVMRPSWQKFWCPYLDNFNLFSSSPPNLFNRSIKSLDGLQLDENTNELPIISYPLPPNKAK